jgi:tetratricopeptide (TPR) repeat protein
VLKDAQARFERLGLDWGVAACLNSLGIHALYQGDAAEAAALFTQFLTNAESTANQRARAMGLGNLGWAHYYLGDLPGALTFSTEAASLAEQYASSAPLGSARHLLGVLALQRGERDEAASLLAEALRLRWDLGDKWNLARVLEAVAAVMVANGRAEASARVYGTIEALREAIDSSLMVLDTEAYVRHRAAAQVALGEAGFSRHLTEGRHLPLAIAVSEATAALTVIGAPNEEPRCSREPGS